MRFVYLDEVGTGKPEVDPYVVVAAVILNADRQWKAIESHLKQLADVYIRPEHRTNFVFHAKDLFHGSGVTTRDLYPKSTRYEILEQLCKVTKLFELPIVACEQDRKKQDKTVGIAEQTRRSLIQAAANCAANVELYMVTEVQNEEVAILVYEQDNESKTALRETHNYLRTNRLAGDQWSLQAAVVPFQRIVDTAHFARKTDTSLLALADVSAFFTARKLAKRSNCEPFFSLLKEQMFCRPNKV